MAAKKTKKFGVGGVMAVNAPRKPAPAGPVAIGPKAAMPVVNRTPVKPGATPYVDPTPNVIPRGATGPAIKAPMPMVNRTPVKPGATPYVDPTPNILRPKTPLPARTPNPATVDAIPRRAGMNKGGTVSASSRGDGIAKRGKTRGKVC